MKARLPLRGQLGSVIVDTKATNGAVVGVNLRWADGTLVQVSDFGTAPVSEGPVSRTLWSLVSEIPTNVSAVAALATDGFVRRTGAAWSASPIVNADLSGANTGGLAEGTNLYFTNARADARIAAHVALSDPHTQYILESEKGVALGVVPLASDGKIDTAYIPASVLGQVEYKGTWDATGAAPTTTPENGWYYIVTVAGSTNLSGITDWNVGDWAIYNVTAWNKVDNTDAVSSVAGLTGAVSVSSLKTALSIGNVDNTSDANKPVSAAQQTAIDAKVVDSIASGDTTRAPSRGSVFTALAGKASKTAIVARANSAAAQSIANGAYAKVLLATEVFDYGSFYDPATSRFTPTVAGLYLTISTAAFNTTVSSGSRVGVGAAKNGTVVDNQTSATHTKPINIVQHIAVYSMNGTTDFLELHAYQDATTSMNLIGNYLTNMVVSYLGALA